MKRVLIGLVATLLLGACETEDIFPLTIGAAELEVEVVDTPEARARGLMFRESLPEDRGMLFVFERSEPRAFYMRNTEIPLSIAYIDDRRVIREMHDMEPFSLESVPSRYPAMYALEVNQGAFDRLGIRVGDRLEFSDELTERIGE